LNIYISYHLAHIEKIFGKLPSMKKYVKMTNDTLTRQRAYIWTMRKYKMIKRASKTDSHQKKQLPKIADDVQLPSPNHFNMHSFTKQPQHSPPLPSSNPTDLVRAHSIDEWAETISIKKEVGPVFTSMDGVEKTQFLSMCERTVSDVHLKLGICVGYFSFMLRVSKIRPYAELNIGYTHHKSKGSANLHFMLKGDENSGDSNNSLREGDQIEVTTYRLKNGFTGMLLNHRGIERKSKECDDTGNVVVYPCVVHRNIEFAMDTTYKRPSVDREYKPNSNKENLHTFQDTYKLSEIDAYSTPLLNKISHGAYHVNPDPSLYPLRLVDNATEMMDIDPKHDARQDVKLVDETDITSNTKEKPMNGNSSLNTANNNREKPVNENKKRKKPGVKTITKNNKPTYMCLCTYDGCETRAALSVFIDGEIQRRCKKHGGQRYCNVKNCPNTRKRLVPEGDEYGEAGHRCDTHSLHVRRACSQILTESKQNTQLLIVSQHPFT